MRAYLRLLRFAAPHELPTLAAILCMVAPSLATAAYANLLGPDGLGLREVTPASLRAQLAVVIQETARLDDAGRGHEGPEHEEARATAARA